MGRAINYAKRVHPTDRPRVRRYVASRARAMGHADLLPIDWKEAHMPVATSLHGNLDRQLELKAEEYGIGVAKLKAVYFRGVEEYNSSDFDLGTPTMWGLARVQRFINCVMTGAPMTSDHDLLEISPEEINCDVVDIAVDSSPLLLDVLYLSGEDTAALFAPAEVASISLEDDIITVEGMLDGKPWNYTFNTVSGEHDLRIE